MSPLFKSLPVLLLPLGGVSTAQQAQVNVATLLAACESSNPVAQSSCGGYILAVWDRYFATGRNVCIPDDAEPEDALAVFIEVARANPQFNNFPAFQFTDFALNTAWPCANSGLVAEHSGSWYDPARDGEGFNIEVVLVDDGAGGTRRVLVVYWYTYDRMTQMWLTGAVPFSAGSTTVEVPLTVTDGADFGPNFDPNAVNRTPWGTLTLTFQDCDNASGSYTSTQGFGSGTLTLTRLTGRLGDICISPSEDG